MPRKKGGKGINVWLTGVDTDTHKTCRHCRVLKPNTEFWEHGGKRNKLQSNCKECSKLLSRESKRKMREKMKGTPNA